MQGTYPVQDTVRLWSPWVFTMALRGTFQIAVALRRYWNHSKVCWNSWILQYYCARNHISCNYLHAWWKISDNNFKMYMGVYSFSTFFAGQQLKSLETTVLDFCTSVFPGDVLRITPEIDGGGKGGSVWQSRGASIVTRKESWEIT